MRNCVFSLLLALLTSTAIASCTPSPAPAAVEPPVQPLVIGTTPTTPIAITAETAATPAEDPPLAASTTLAIPARDPRLARSLHRPRPLMVTELQALESLFTATASTSTDRPALIRRLAEGYAELSLSINGATAAHAHAFALKYYELLTVDYPQYAQIDEAYYYAALEHELAGDFRDARRLYFELIKRSSNSKLIPFAYFGFGEIFFAEATIDPSKDELALQAYAEVLKYPAANNAVYADAKRRIAEVKARKAGNTKGNASGTRGVTRP
jgi:tetratricopeptide (TPR) repeat protein